jgi:hypothetical protein
VIPNTFLQIGSKFQPSGRWRAQFPLDQLPDFERLVGAYFETSGLSGGG